MNNEIERAKAIKNNKIMSGIKKELEPMKVYEIWIGHYHLGPGHNSPTEPEKVATVAATTFKIACLIHEHQSVIDNLRERMIQPGAYIEDIYFGTWDYKAKTNSNSWTGKYYETEQEAWKSF